MMGTELLLTGGLLIAFYILICNRVTVAMHPIRMRLADLGAHLLEQSDIPEEIRDGIKVSLDHAYSSSIAWFCAILLPLAVVSSIRDQIVGRRDDEFDSVPADKRADVKLFCGLALLSVIANSPIAALLVALQLFFYMVLWLPISQIVLVTARTAITLESSVQNFSRGHHWNQAT